MGIQMLPGYRDPYHGRPLTKGELGCFLSHYNIWKEVGVWDEGGLTHSPWSPQTRSVTESQGGTVVPMSPVAESVATFWCLLHELLSQWPDTREGAVTVLALPRCRKWTWGVRRLQAKSGAVTPKRDLLAPQLDSGQQLIMCHDVTQEPDLEPASKAGWVECWLQMMRGRK